MPSLKKLFKTVVSELVKIIGMNFYVKTIKCLPLGNKLRAKFINAAYCQSFKKFIKSEGFYYQSDCNDALNFSARLDFMNWEVNSRRVFAKNNGCWERQRFLFVCHLECKLRTLHKLQRLLQLFESFYASI